VIDPPSQFTGPTPPIDVFAAQEIREHANLPGQDRAQFGAEAVDGFYFHQGPDQQGTEHVGQRLPVGAALAADGRAEQSGQPVTPEAFGEFSVGEGQGLAEGIGQGSIGAGLAAGLLGLEPGTAAVEVSFSHR